ncbi:MAG TPA: hypothetical protein VIP77_17365 [Jiangellaceae bacterium]
MHDLATARPATPHRRPTSWEEVTTAFMADALTARPIDDPHQLAALAPTGETQEKVARATALLGRLEAHAHKLRRDVAGDERVLHLLRAINDGDAADLARLGVDIEYAWLDDVLTAVVSGAPYVEIETVGPYAAHHIDADGRLDVSFDNLPADERAGILLAALLRDAFEDSPNVRIVALLDDLNDDLGGRDFSAADRDRYVVQMSKIFYEYGVLRHNDVPGRDYVLLRESAAENHVDDLIERLAASGHGRIEQTDSGDVVFRPSAAFVERLALNSPSRIREFGRRGILLKRSGRATCHALDAAGFLDPINEHVMHVVMLDARFTSQQDKTYALLRAIEVVHQESHHNVFYDAEVLSPEAIAFAVCHVLIHELRRLISLLGRYDAWAEFDSTEYLTRNYGTTILPEDLGILRFVSAELEQLGVAESTLQQVIDVGAGPNLYPAMLVAPCLADGGTLTLLEYAASNRAALEYGLGEIATDFDSSPWQKFEDAMRSQSQRYDGVAARLPSVCRVVAGSVFDLPEEAHDLATSFFVAESITTSRREFRVAMRALVRTVKPGGVLITAHMVGSTGYHAGEGTRFPAVHLTPQDIEEACRDADLDFTLHLVGDDAVKARSGYEGMAVVVARRTR